MGTGEASVPTLGSIRHRKTLTLEVEVYRGLNGFWRVGVRG